MILTTPPCAPALLFSSSRAISTTSAAGFVSKDKDVTFALNIPQADENNDLYFTLSGPSSSSWIVSSLGTEAFHVVC